LLFSVAANATPEWQHRLLNFDRSQYMAGFQTWMITQDSRGWLYAANNHGLLEFDGVDWSLYPIRNTIIRSLKIIGPRIYVGGSSEYGFYEPNHVGLLTYHSLSESVKDWGGEIWNILEATDRIYFVSDKHIHIYKDTTWLKTLYVHRKIDCSALVDDRLLFGATDGLFYLDDNDEPEGVPASAPLKGSKIIGVVPYEGQLLVATANSGLYLTGPHEATKVRSAADAFIRDNRLFSLAVVGSKVALGSVQHGAFLFDLQQPEYHEGFNLDNGLKNNTVLCSYFDRDGNLWLGLDKGISYIDLSSPIRPLFATVSPIGTGYCSMVYNDEYYFGTNQGLYKVSHTGQYQLVPESEGQIWSMALIDGSLFCSGDNGILVISPDEQYRIDLSGVWEIHALAGPSHKLLAAIYSGFCLLEKKDGRWRYTYTVSGFFNSAKGFMEDDEPGNFWIINAAHRIQKITFDPTISDIVKIKEYTAPVCGSNVFFRRIDNNIVVCAEDGIYRYSRLTDSFDHYTQLETMLDGAAYYEYLNIDPLKNIWFVSNYQLRMLPFANDAYQPVYNIGLNNELINHYENIFLPDSTTAVVAVDNAFLKIDLSKTDILPPVKTYIRQLACSKNDSILSYGSTHRPVVLPYSHNSVILRFAASAFPLRSDILYVYRLNDMDADWSLPSPNTFKEYTNLPEGHYVFEVKAIVDGQCYEESISRIEFEIRPPWHRSWLALITYVLAVALLLFSVYVKTIRKQKRIIHLKGQELIAQRRRHSEETKVKDREIDELQAKNLQAELNFKTQELSGYILNVIRKNEMLEEVKKNAVSIAKAIDEKKEPMAVKQKVNRLISQINTNIANDSDFEVFESNFNLIHQDFFKLLDERFPALNRSEKTLCAYLKMNLSSKEIAPLLNISIRGVEVNRYRLRKRMGLSHDVNLTEYLQSL
jgi:DNA-binding CsgD family transcriptional regulator